MAENFEIGYSVVSNAFKHIVFKKEGDNYFLKISNIVNVPTDFNQQYFPATLENKEAINKKPKHKKD